MKEKVIVSASTLAASLITYLYAKHAEKDAIPYVMIGGFIGGVIGEMIAHAGDNNNPPPSGVAITN